MKKLLLLVAVVAMVLPGCKKINEALDSLDDRLNKLEQEAIPTIDEQIAAINTTLGNLDAMDKELKGYIDGLTATATNLQEQIDNTNTKIEEVKTALQSEISTAKADVLAQLNAAKTELENELTQINATITTLQEKDVELEGKITELRTYVDTELGKTTDWANATFATLEQYNALVLEVATIKEQIKAINQSIAELETRLTTKINNDIATAVATLNADIQQKVSEITTAYTNAIKSAKEEITAAYTAAIQTAINALDASLKSWVGEQLAGYYTIAHIDAKLTTLNNAITNGDDALQKELNTLKNQLSTTTNEITAAYKKAIEEAINTSNGVINTNIANEIAAVNHRIDNEVATTNAKIAAIEARLDNVEAKITELLARIQSMSYIPEYADGKVKVGRLGYVSVGELSFRISPKNIVAELEKVWSSAISCEAYYPKTRTVSLVKLPVTDFVGDSENGIITVKVSGEKLSEVFFADTQEAKIAIVISDGNNQVVSDYADAYGYEITDEIWYTSTDGNVIEPKKSGIEIFGANIISNTYENGKGIVKFDGTVTTIGEYAYGADSQEEGLQRLENIILPNSVATISQRAFKYSGIVSMITPSSVTYLGKGAFAYCKNLTKITLSDNIEAYDTYLFIGCSNLSNVNIPQKWTYIPYHAFDECSSLKEINISDNINSISGSAFKGCISLTNLTIPDSVTSIGEGAFDGCISLKNISLGNCLTDIGAWAFHSANIESITLPESLQNVGNAAFASCSKLKYIYGKFASKDNRCLILDNGTLVHLSSQISGNYTLPSSVKILGFNSFSYPQYKVSITIPESVEGVMERFNIANTHHITGFYGKFSADNNRALIKDNVLISVALSGLTSYTVPEGVIKIREYLFSHSNGFKSVTLPTTLEVISKKAFEYCKDLSTLYCKTVTPPVLDSTPFEGNKNFPTIYVPSNSVNAYKSAEGWSNYASYIEGYDFEN